jgi:arginyl-tRNA synthetase
VISRDLRHSIARAVAAVGLERAADPGLRPTGTPGQYAASVALALGGNPRETAQSLAEKLAQEQWIEAVEVTGPGYLTITVTPEALTSVADSITSAGPACVTSDALAGVTVPAAPPGNPLAARTWEAARAALAAQLTVRLAAAAGATVAEFAASERVRLSLQGRPSSLVHPEPHAEVSPTVSSPRSRKVAPEPAEPPVPQLPAPGVPPYMSGAPRHDIYGNFMTRTELTASVTDAVTSVDASGVSRPRSDDLAPVPPAAGRRQETAIAAAVAFAGRDAVTFTLARAIPGKPLRVDPEIMARHVLGNPAYAVRYAHARAASGVRWAATSSAAVTPRSVGVPLCPPTDPGELALLDALSWLPERVATAARRGRPDEFARYLEDLASVTVDILSSTSHPDCASPDWAAAPGSDRLTLAMAARTGLAAGLGMLGVSAPDRL